MPSGLLPLSLGVEPEQKELTALTAGIMSISRIPCRVKRVTPYIILIRPAYPVAIVSNPNISPPISSSLQEPAVATSFKVEIN